MCRRQLQNDAHLHSAVRTTPFALTAPLRRVLAAFRPGGLLAARLAAALLALVAIGVLALGAQPAFGHGNHDTSNTSGHVGMPSPPSYECSTDQQCGLMWSAGVLPAKTMDLNAERSTTLASFDGCGPQRGGTGVGYFARTHVVWWVKTDTSSRVSSGQNTRICGAGTLHQDSNTFGTDQSYTSEQYWFTPPPSWNTWRDQSWTLEVSADGGDFRNASGSTNSTGFYIDSNGVLKTVANRHHAAGTYILKISVSP